MKKEKETLISPHENLPIMSSPRLNSKAVFWDLDGVIYDSLPQYVTAWKEGFKCVNIDIPDEYVYVHEGRAGLDTVREIFKVILKREPTKSESDKILSKKNEILLSLGKPQLMDNIKEVLGEIQKSGLPFWIVTGSSKEGIKEQVEQDLDGLINSNNIITGNDVSFGKPHPEPYLMAFSKAGINPCEAIVIENAPLGIRSAVSSGAFCIAINTGILPDSVLKEAGAEVVFSDFAQLANKWNSII